MEPGQMQATDSLADALHSAAAASALVRLRVAHLCGAHPRGAGAPVDTQLFRPFQHSTDLLASEAAAAVAADPLDRATAAKIAKARLAACRSDDDTTCCFAVHAWLRD
jgi:hypothetical protein